MKYRLLADTGVFVSELCLGAMTFGGKGQMWETIGGMKQSEVTTMVGSALDGGINFIDTADVYSTGESEVMTGKALKGKRQDVVLATKVRGRMSAGHNDVGLSRLHIMQGVEASLKRLGTDYIDLYQIHRSDALTNIEEDTLRALDDLVRQGKVRYIGCSNLPAWELMRALGVSRAQNLESFKCTQSFYSLSGRELERDTIPLLNDQGLGLLVWSPLAGGFLSGKFTRGGKGSGRRASFDFPPIDKERGYDIVDTLAAIAKIRKVTVAQIALAWVLANNAVTSVIIGARKMEQLKDNLGAVNITLTADELAKLDAVSRLPLPYPLWMESMGSDRRPGEVRSFDTAKTKGKKTKSKAK